VIAMYFGQHFAINGDIISREPKTFDKIRAFSCPKGPVQVMLDNSATRNIFDLIVDLQKPRRVRGNEFGG